MKSVKIFSLLVFLSWALISWSTDVEKWMMERHSLYNLHYTSMDRVNLGHYRELIETGIHRVQTFFDEPFNGQIDVYFYPDRQSLDSTWQKDWKAPGFRSECWMVASGVAGKLDILSPAVWDQQACEHRYADTVHTQQLITHELVHVFHGQHNASPDFTNMEGLDWFVEGLATWASGQYDSGKAAEVRNALIGHQIPLELDSFWTGKLRYGLSGSMVAFIEDAYGRKKLRELLPFNHKEEVLSSLHTTERDLLSRWKAYMLKQSQIANQKSQIANRHSHLFSSSLKNSICVHPSAATPHLRTAGGRLSDLCSAISGQRSIFVISD